MSARFSRSAMEHPMAEAAYIDSQESVIPFTVDVMCLAGNFHRSASFPSALVLSVFHIVHGAALIRW
jgi:hypothetical protein